MKLAGPITLLAALLAAALPAFAQPGGGRHGAGRQERESSERQQMQQERGDLRNDVRGEYWRYESSGGRCEGPCRMTPEERRQLRRDIDDAGRTLYGRGPRRGRD
ncbi:hypothetical protein [Sulfurisoma sediminicola]|uniref:YpeB-like protein with protease inhibitory function n=1 Tax=Sulfurisoma sediminicola TaxID=1381557 RepID=A0A497XDN4_9PROT|nr:hypothetical protein [Sulfurisoma sediminicola]RLJ64809.1 hypothetical protein DFR35_1457 [Sulfurisoma sediminicola]